MDPAELQRGEYQRVGRPSKATSWRKSSTFHAPASPASNKAGSADRSYSVRRRLTL
jgi:hypothetical protein